MMSVRSLWLGTAGAVGTALLMSWAWAQTPPPAEDEEELSAPQVRLTKKQMEEAQQYYQEGLKHFLRRDYRSASAEWQKALAIDRENDKIKEYLDRAQQRYLESLNLFFKGMEHFRKQDYAAAEQSFKNALLINPFDERTKRYLALCAVPEFQITTERKFLMPSGAENRFAMSVNMGNAAPDWIAKWEVLILNPERQVVRTFSGGPQVPQEVVWDLRDAAGRPYAAEKARYAMRLVSIYGRVVSTATNEIAVDNEGPSITVTATTNFMPDDMKGRFPNKVTFQVGLKDAMAGVARARIDVFKSDRTTLIASLPVEPTGGTIVWDGTKLDGSRVAGGDTIYYRVSAVDLASNVTRTELAKIEALIYIDESFRMNLPNIEFAYGKADLLPTSFPILDKVGALLQRFPNARFVIEGHTDNQGGFEFNMRLSQRRAESVYAYLKKQFGIPENRVELKGYGPTRPVAPNDVEENRRKNRRVEIQIINEE